MPCATRFQHVYRDETALIGKLFIRKILDAKPEGVEVGQWIELIFGLHERFIIQYRSKECFELPGLYKPAPQVRIAGLKRGRLVRPGRRIWVRFDKKYQEVIDVEAPIGPSREPKIFQLNQREWTEIKSRIQPVNDSDVEFERRLNATY